MKPDFSKQGLKKFFLYHAEKLILGVSVILMGVFFWLGFSAQPFKEKTPTELVGMADSAGRYIASVDAWEQIRGVEARTGELDLVERITVGNEAIDVAKYPFGFWSIRAKTLSQRKDPQLLPPQDLVASHFVEPVFFSPNKLNPNAIAVDPLSRFPLASDVAEPRGSGATAGGGGSLRGGGLEGDLGAPGGGRGRGGPGGVLGGGIGEPESGTNPPRNEDSRKSDLDAGTEVLSIHEKTFPGIRPRHWQISNQSEQVLLGDVVVVTGLIDVKRLRANYLESFLDSIGYYPSRDKPEFKYLEVQRAMVVDGEEPKWEDISNLIERTQLATPRLLIMPNADYPSAPEIVEEQSFDPVLTSPIPAFTQFDYRSIVNHPKLSVRKPDPLQEKKKAESLTHITGESTTTDDGLDEEKDPVRLGSDVTKYTEFLNKKDAKNSYKLIRFFDLSNKEPGKVYQYRVRAWLSDPNNESSEGGQLAGNEPGAGRGGGGDRGRGGPGLSDMGLGGGARGRGGPGLSDMGLGGGDRGRGGPGLSDMGLGGGDRGRGGPGLSDMGLGGGDRGRGGPGGGMNLGGLGGNPGRGGGTGRDGGSSQSGTGDDMYPYVALSHQMKQPEVRSRLAAAEQKADPKDREKYTYFIQEPGYEGLIQVPIGKEHLRFCRPTPWSDPVKVEIKAQPRGNLIAGKVESSRTIRVGVVDIPESEPSIDLIVAPWDRVFRAMLPGRKKAFRGEALDFAASANVLNPVNWLVHRIENAPILSQSVMVDLMGGSELALPRDELLRHHTASEMLVLQPDGSLRVTSDLADRTKYKQALLHPDDNNEFGTVRKPEPEQPARPRGGQPGGRGR